MRTAQAGVMRWRSKKRQPLLEQISARAKRVTLTRRVLIAILEELHVDEKFESLVGDPRALPKTRYPQALVMAVVLRHSWRQDDLRDALVRLGLREQRSLLSARRGRGDS